MRIAVIGAGAMGLLFGGRLSAGNDVRLVDTNQSRVERINAQGVTIVEPDKSQRLYHPKAALAGEAAEPVELALLFVKASSSRMALEGSRALIGPETILLSLQNGAGHESLLSEFVSKDRVAVGVTQHNASLCGPATVHHGGGGDTVVGSPYGGCPGLGAVAEMLTAGGFQARESNDIRAAVWEKLMMNASSSAMTGVLQARQGLCVDSPSARALLEKLIREAVAVANAEGVPLAAEEMVSTIIHRLENARQGLPSICADLRDGRKTEADVITGAVVEAARRHGISAPTHEAMLLLLHAMEDKRENPQYSEL